MTFEEEIKEKNSELVILLTEVIKNQKKNFKVLFNLFHVMMICYTIIVIGMLFGFFWYEGQFDTKQVDTYTETITQEVDGENSSINNVQGNQYNDNAIHNEEELNERKANDSDNKNNNKNKDKK